MTQDETKAALQAVIGQLESIMADGSLTVKAMGYVTSAYNNAIAAESSIQPVMVDLYFDDAWLDEITS